jgi:hypothetical protein
VGPDDAMLRLQVDRMSENVSGDVVACVVSRPHVFHEIPLICLVARVAFGHIHIYLFLLITDEGKSGWQTRNGPEVMAFT